MIADCCIHQCWCIYCLVVSLSIHLSPLRRRSAHIIFAQIAPNNAMSQWGCLLLDRLSSSRCVGVGVLLYYYFSDDTSVEVDQSMKSKRNKIHFVDDNNMTVYLPYCCVAIGHGCNLLHHRHRQQRVAGRRWQGGNGLAHSPWLRRCVCWISGEAIGGTGRRRRSWWRVVHGSCSWSMLWSASILST